MPQHLWSPMILICVSRHQMKLVHRVITTHWYTYQEVCAQRVTSSSRWAQLEYCVTNAVEKWSVLKMVELMMVQELLSAVVVQSKTLNLSVQQVICPLIPCKFANWTISKHVLLLAHKHARSTLKDCLGVWFTARTTKTAHEATLYESTSTWDSHGKCHVTRNARTPEMERWPQYANLQQWQFMYNTLIGLKKFL